MRARHSVIARYVLGATMMALVATPAMAQDDDDAWTGFYVGGQATGSSDKVDAQSTLLITQISNLQVTGRGLVVVPGTTLASAASHRDTGLTGGVFAGYQFQSGNLLFGLEGDYAPFHRDVGTSQSQALPPTALTPATTIIARRDVRLTDQFSARVRLGYAAGKTLLYVNGGYARTSAMVSAVDSFNNAGGLAASCAPAPCQANLGPEGPVVTTATERHALSGWTAGGGIERRLSKLLSIGLEYRHTDFGGHDFALANRTTVNTGAVTVGDNGQPGVLGSVAGGATRIKLQSDALSLRIALHF